MPIGVHLTPSLDNLAKGKDLPHASTLNANRLEVCPVNIHFANVSRGWREKAGATVVPAILGDGFHYTAEKIGSAVALIKSLIEVPRRLKTYLELLAHFLSHQRVVFQENSGPSEIGTLIFTRPDLTLPSYLPLHYIDVAQEVRETSV